MTTSVLSDAHLFQTYLDWYDSVGDFERVFQECEDAGVDAYILAGDVFDYKTTNTTYLRHYQGEEYLVRLRELFRSLEKPVYAVRGNHEKQVVLESLEQTVENFHYQEGRHWVTVDDRDVLLLDTHYRTEGYRNEVVGLFEEIGEEGETRSNPVLVMHETLGGVDTALPDGAVEAVSDSFDLVLNGHMHRLERGVAGFDNVVNLPSLLPSRLVRGSYWKEQYRWEDGEVTHESRESPFAYVSLEEDGFEVHRFEPSRTVVEVTMDLSGLPVGEARTRFEEVLDDLAGRSDSDELLVYPEVRGELRFSPILLEDVADGFSGLFVTDLKSDGAEKVPPELEGTETATSIVSAEDLQDEVLDAVPDIVEQLEEEGVDADRESVTRVVEYVTGEDSDVFESSQRPRVVDGVRRFIESNTEAVDREELPDNFETHLKGLAEEVKQ